MKVRGGAHPTDDGLRLQRRLEERLGFALDEVVVGEEPHSSQELAAMVRSARLIEGAGTPSPEHRASCSAGVAETLARASNLLGDGARERGHLRLVSGGKNQHHSSSRRGWNSWGLGSRLGRPAWTVASAIILGWGAVRVGLEVSLRLNDMPFFC